MPLSPLRSSARFTTILTLYLHPLEALERELVVFLENAHVRVAEPYRLADEDLQYLALLPWLLMFEQQRPHVKQREQGVKGAQVIDVSWVTTIMSISLSE